MVTTAQIKQPIVTTGGTSCHQTGTITPDNINFHGRAVSKADASPYKLSVYLANNHSFIKLEDKERDVAIAAGLYPNESEEMKTGYAALPEILVSKLPGAIGDEFDSYKSQNGFESKPKVTFPLLEEEAMEIEEFVMDYADACNKNLPGCIYQALTFNCVDFAQTAFSKTSYPGHFVEYFPTKMLMQDFGEATAYASLSAPHVQACLKSSTLMLAVSMGSYLVPKAASAATSLGSWLTSSLWPKATANEPIDPKTLQSRYKSVKSSFYACENFWAEFHSRNQATSALISESTDLQFRFLEVEKTVEKEGYGGKSQAGLDKELKMLEQDFRTLDEKLKVQLGKSLNTAS
ncbi:hypothetical protein [Endozoicomonas lisbonensis]|uniref:Uncharacterized protein n=1 Tax=Endozoicomonas lisbonensis TaxID=3120522 RepID=A0ABV2SFZ5_9GAMM